MPTSAASPVSMLVHGNPGCATIWRLKTKTLSLTARPLLMGIVNATPDSFSDGGAYVSKQAAIEHALQLAADGADILDIGGESTRPYSTPVDEGEELRRVVPVIEEVARRTDLPVSIDTSKASVARAALDLGAEIINDVTGLAGDPRMIETAVASSAAVCVMHMQGTPQTMQIAPAYLDVINEVYDYLRVRKESLVAAGVDAARICLDPGIGFGKTHEHNLALLANCHRFHGLGCPLLVGHSRKGFIAKIVGEGHSSRLHGTLGAALALASQGVQILRVHDVRAVREALLVYEAAGGIQRLS